MVVVADSEKSPALSCPVRISLGPPSTVLPQDDLTVSSMHP